MLTKIITAMTALFALFGIKMLNRREAEEAGKTEQQRDDAEGRLDDIQQAKIIRDQLNNPDHQQRVRDRFTRH